LPRGIDVSHSVLRAVISNVDGNREKLRKALENGDEERLRKYQSSYSAACRGMQRVLSESHPRFRS